MQEQGDYRPSGGCAARRARPPRVPFHRVRVMPKEYLGGFRGQSPPPANKAAPTGCRPILTPLADPAARPEPNGSFLVGQDSDCESAAGDATMDPLAQNPRQPTGRVRSRVRLEDWILSSGRIGLPAGMRDQGSRPRAGAHSPITSRSAWNCGPRRLTTTRASWTRLVYTRRAASALSARLARTCHSTPRWACACRHTPRSFTRLLVGRQPPSGGYLHPRSWFEKAYARANRPYRPLRPCHLKLETDLLWLATSRESVK